MKSITKLLITESYSIRQAMSVIDASTIKIAFVVDDQKKLIASVSDGDIRRALLAGKNIDDGVSTIMNNAPKSVFRSTSIDQRKKLLNSNNLQCLPVLSDSSEIIGVCTKESLNQHLRVENPILIMAGGFGKRLRPLTDNCPKPMLPVAGKPLLEHTINQLKYQGFYKFYLSTFYLPEFISSYFEDGSKFGVQINYLRENSPLGTGGALSLLSNKSLDLPLIVLNGDVFTDLDFSKLLDFHNKNNFDSTMCLREVKTRMSYGLVKTQGDLVLSLNEKPVLNHNINMGIYAVSASLVKSMQYNKEITMPELIEKRRDSSCKTGAFWHNGYWLDIGGHEDYQKAQKDIKNFLF